MSTDHSYLLTCSVFLLQLFVWARKVIILDTPDHGWCSQKPEVHASLPRLFPLQSRRLCGKEGWALCCGASQHCLLLLRASPFLSSWASFFPWSNIPYPFQGACPVFRCQAHRGSENLFIHWWALAFWPFCFYDNGCCPVWSVLHDFPNSAVANDRKLSGLNHHTLILLSFWRLEV